MVAEFPQTTGIQLGPRGPFPDIPITRTLERRWLHYAFLSRDNTMGLVANVSWLGATADIEGATPHCMPILLLYNQEDGWVSSQFNARTLDSDGNLVQLDANAANSLWSAFRLPHAFNEPRPFALKSASETPFVNLMMQRTTRPCNSQCAPFAKDQFFRWQSEPGIIATGDWGFDKDQVYSNVEAVGYHERVRGYWGWPELGGWVFGFANDPEQREETLAPPTAVVFTLIQPLNPPDAPTGSVMLWREGRLRRHFPRRNVSVAVRGYFDRDRVTQVPPLSHLFGVAPMVPIPRRLMITARLGEDWVVLDFFCESAARIIISSETNFQAYSVHEVFGPCLIEGQVSGQSFQYETSGIVEFAGGAYAD